MFLPSSRRYRLGITLLVVVIIILSSVAIIVFLPEEKKEISKAPIEAVIDDRISPLENQGLVFEILRLRHRGLYDQLTSSRNDWKNKPTFYFITDIDGLEYISKNVQQHGNVDETFFNTWDTIFQENKIVKDVEEEQETSVVSLTIIEVVEKGILGLRTQEIERDSFTVIYDYRTGRWDGDDYFKDEDGYGYYLGETFEIWFNLYQMDYDNDYIPYWTEVNVLGTDPMRDDSRSDPDNDGIPTTWEWKWGYDPFTWDDHEILDPDLDGLENIEEYQMSKWFADPFTQDVYVEIDVMKRGGPLDPPHYLYEESKQGIIEKYAEHNIHLFIDDGWPNTPENAGGDLLPHYERLSQDSGMILQFYNNYFPDERKGIFRYVVIGHAGGFNHPAKGNIYDSIYIFNNLYNLQPIQKLSQWLRLGIVPTARGYRVALGAVLMHELGHSVGIMPWGFEGCDNITYGFYHYPKKEYRATWSNYDSVMNYECIYDMDLFDYSDGSNGPPYDQNDWEQLFVPSFQYNNELIEEPFFEPPGYDKIVSQENKFGVTHYRHDENLTAQFTQRMEGKSPVAPIDISWSVFRLQNESSYPSNRTIKIYAKPIVEYSNWVAYAEGYVDSEGTIQFFSMQDAVAEALSQR